jgi:integrase/recombinase XerD
VGAHLNILQRRLREIRAHLLASQAELGGGQMGGATASRASSEPTPAREDISPLAEAPAAVFLDPASDPSFLPPTLEEEPPPVSGPLTSASEASSSKEEREDQHVPTVQALPVAGNADALLPSTMTINDAISLFLQGEHTHDWSPKTREWHKTSLSQLQRYAAWRKLLLLSSLTASEIRGWLTFLRTEALVTGTFRVQSTISTYARSAHACCAWLVGQGHLEQSPFAQMKIPKGTKRRLHLIEQETFERLLSVCHAAKTKRPTRVDFATVRNRALLWVLWGTGLLVSEMCALNLEDVDLAQGILHVQRTGPRERSLPLTPQVQQALSMYLEQYRLRTGKRGASDPLFLSEQRARLTPNVFTLLFQRLCTRAGLEDRRLAPTMLRETFAIRFLQADGPPKALRRLLGLVESTPIKRYLVLLGPLACGQRPLLSRREQEPFL